jgi:endoglucanase
MQDFSTISRRGFLRKSALALAGAGTMLQFPTRAAESTFAVPTARLDRLGTGANICRWFRFPRKNLAEHLSGYIPAEEATLMARMGLKHVRLCVAPDVIMDPKTGAVLDERAVLLDSAVKRLQDAGLLVVVDIHNEDRAAELNSEWRDAFVKFWSSFAARLSKFDPDLTILETINEPVFDKHEEDWNAFNVRLLAAMRENAPKHTLMTSGPNWGGIDGLKKLKIVPDKNVIYSFHCYDPFPFTHQGATWSGEAVKPLRGVPYPSSPELVQPLLPELEAHPESKSLLEKYGRDHWNKEKLAARFRQGIQWGAVNGVPLYCGEFGVYPPHSKPEHRANWFRDFGQVLTENKIGWAVWGWDEGFGLNRRIRDGKVAVDPVVAEALGLKAV